MKEILKANLEMGSVKLPEKAGIVAFFGADGMLMCGMTSNIANYLAKYFIDDIEEKNLGELIDKTERVGYRETQKMFDALLGMKGLVAKYQPPFNQIVRYYDAYQYLGLNFVKVPYVKVESTTVNDYFFVGPFRSRFFLHDVIDIQMEHFHTPACPGEAYPCELAAAGCAGYCEGDLKKLQEDLVRYYLVPKEEYIQELEQKKEAEMQQLRFAEAERIGIQKKQLEKFYNYIAFLIVTKNINLKYQYEGKMVMITEGMIERVEGRRFDNITREYMPNELYAVDKSELDERWVIFNEIKDSIPGELLKSYEMTIEKLSKYLSGKED